MKIGLVLFLATLLVLVTMSCGQNSPAAQNVQAEPANSDINRAINENAAERASLIAADVAWSNAAAKLDVDAVADVMTEDGSTLPPNQPIAKGRDAIRKGWKELLSLKDVSIKWEPSNAQVAGSGEIGYTTGTWTMAWTGDKGEKLKDNGKYLEVWKKVNGQWKCYLDMYSSDNPPVK